MENLFKGIKRRIGSISFGFSLLLIWQIVAMIIDAAYIIPSPIQVLQKTWDLRENLILVQLPATMTITLVGLVISIVLGVSLAVLMETSEHIERAVYPVVIISQTIPTTAIAPLFVLWFGYGIWSKILVTILITFFPITISVFDGFKETKRDMEDLLKSFGATKSEIFFKLKIPTALPNFFSAIKMAIPLSIIGAAISEWLGAQSGLGYFSKRMMTQLDGAGVFAPILLLSIVAMILVSIVSILEKKIITWRGDI